MLIKNHLKIIKVVINDYLVKDEDKLKISAKHA